MMDRSYLGLLGYTRCLYMVNLNSGQVHFRIASLWFRDPTLGNTGIESFSACFVILGERLIRAVPNFSDSWKSLIFPWSDNYLLSKFMGGVAFKSFLGETITS
ncbi:hypothetical protein CDAR_617961 [Caerostris darwini]|uniref:Uncharacterized protein n=1 Tax=Caerostris darwini TaxID=1538125 RepID=A0AAV4U240_9ARAC|nr:hypothetical protein CDAR_617961 [Caerostris darwini]